MNLSVKQKQTPRRREKVGVAKEEARGEGLTWDLGVGR